MTPTKFMNFSKFARLGVIGSRYIRKGKLLLLVCIYTVLFLLVYNDLGYAQIVADLAEESMQVAVDEVKSLSHYTEKGEVLVCV